jgi:hypothetical protein
MKANSTDITITNSKFYNGLGIAMGSIGQYKDQFETIERVTVKNIEYYNTLHAVSDQFQVDVTKQYSYMETSLTTQLFSSILRHGQPIRMATHRTEVAADSDVSYFVFLYPVPFFDNSFPCQSINALPMTCLRVC